MTPVMRDGNPSRLCGRDCPPVAPGGDQRHQPPGLCQFSTFDVNRYSADVEPELGISARAYMEKLLHYCENYAQKFSSKSTNLLFMGHTGLGKTHLALAIADAVLGGGHDVLYTSAAALAARLGGNTLILTAATNG